MLSKTTILTSLMLVTLAQPGWAINKCIGPGGKITYTDAACASTDKAQKLELVVIPPNDLKQAEESNNRIKRTLETLESSNRLRSDSNAAPAAAPAGENKRPVEGENTSEGRSSDDDKRRREKGNQ